MATEFDNRVNISRRTSMTCYIALMFSFGFNCFVLKDYPGTVPLFLTGLQSLPLLIFIPGLLKDSHRTHIWLCFLMLFYFTVYAVNVTAPERTSGDTVIFTLCILLFISSMMFTRWKKRQNAAEEGII